VDDHYECEQPCSDLITKIEEENKKIKEYYDRLKEQINSILVFNKELIRWLEVYKVKSKLEYKEILKKHFKK